MMCVSVYFSLYLSRKICMCDCVLFLGVGRGGDESVVIH